MNIQIGHHHGRRRSTFDARHFALENRLPGLESFVNGAPDMRMGGASYEPLSKINENLNLVERYVAEGFWLSKVTTSGYQLSTKNTLSPKTKIPHKLTVCQIKSGHVELRMADRILNLSAGDIYLHETHKFHTLYGPCELTRIVYPADYFRDLLTGKDDVVVLSTDNPMNRVANATISGLEDALERSMLNELPQLSNIARELTYNVLAANFRTAQKSRYALTRERARAYVLENLAETDLNVNSIANHANVSRATLYRAFEEEGGVRELINELRLDAARQMLQTRPPSRGLMVHIAYSCGFRSPAQFNRAFKERFGLTPGAFSERYFPG